MSAAEENQMDKNKSQLWLNLYWVKKNTNLNLKFCTKCISV